MTEAFISSNDFEVAVAEAITASTVSFWKAENSFIAFSDFSKPSFIASLEAAVTVSKVSLAASFLAAAMAVSPEMMRGGEGFRVFGLAGAFAAGAPRAVFALVTGADFGAGAVACVACDLVSTNSASPVFGVTWGADFGVSSLAIAELLHRLHFAAAANMPFPSPVFKSFLCSAQNARTRLS
ncbi:MAG: hypothetical protein ACOC05_06080 [Oceanicaulis sp.]